MLRAFGHRVAMCCDMLGLVDSSLKMPVKFNKPTTPNMLQNIATGWPTARNMLCPTMLRYIVLACCDRLARAKRYPAAKSLSSAGISVNKTNLDIHWIVIYPVD